MSNTPDSCQPDSETSVISNALANLGPKSLTGDQGSWTGHSVDDAIKTIEFQRKSKLNNKTALTNALRTISGIRLMPHDGRGS